MKRRIVFLASFLILVSALIVYAGTLGPIRQNVDLNFQPLIGAIKQAGIINAYDLAANTAVYATVPTGANTVIIGKSSGLDIWVLFGSTSGLTIPSGNITNGTSAELNPSARVVTGVTSIGIISPTVGFVTLSYFQ